jgi:hypothetical protein
MAPTAVPPSGAHGALPDGALPGPAARPPAAGRGAGAPAAREALEGAGGRSRDLPPPTPSPPSNRDFVPGLMARLSPAARAELEALMAEERAARGALPSAQARNRQLRERLEATGLTPEPSLADLADRGEVRFSLTDPLTGHEPLSPEALAALGLDARQGAAIEDLYRAAGDDLVALAREIYAEVSGDADGGGAFTLGALVDAIRDATPPEEWEAAVRAVARAQAGHAPAAEGGSPAEQMLAALVAQQEHLRSQLVALVGEDVADAVMAQAGVVHTIGVGPGRRQ